MIDTVKMNVGLILHKKWELALHFIIISKPISHKVRSVADFLYNQELLLHHNKDREV